MTTEEFIQKAKAVHGDKYDYSKVEYVNNKTKVCITCPEHGEFWQRPNDHISHVGCPLCSLERNTKLRVMSNAEFIQKANAIHGDKYDYSKVEYVNNKTKVCIICPIHGEFWQNASSHIRGAGCPVCADIENGRRKRKWTYETCYEEAKKYTTKYDFAKQNNAAYVAAGKYGWLRSFVWLKNLVKPNGYWTRERCEEESRKYHSKKEFVKGCAAAHQAAVRHGWLDDFTWLVNQRIDVVKDKIDSVYVYLFEDAKAAYVGRTLIKRQRKRDREHIFNQDSDAVARYAKKLNVPVPPMTILESNLTLEEGQAREDYWRKWYKKHGYTMLNRIATGIGKGSLGAIGQGKWNRRTCREEALKYKTATEFEKNSSGAYAAALRNNWLKDYTWFAVLLHNWDKQTCYNEAKKYCTRGDFYKGCRGAYIKALKTGWIEEYTWLKSRQNVPAGYWDNYEHCYGEAKKYKNRRRFQKGCMGAYSKALKNGWLDDYTWFDEKAKQNYWNRETCLEEAKKCSSKKEFRSRANGAYQLAYKNGWLNDYTWFKQLTGFWTYEACKTEASKYRTRGQFAEGSRSAYTKARIKGWLDDFFPMK